MNSEFNDAIRDNDLACVRQMLHDEPGLLRQTDEYGATPLMCAVSTMERSAEGVRLLIEAGADVNARTGEGYTALHYAVDVVDWNEPHDQVSARIIQLLVDAGARLEERQHWGWTPLMEAVMRGDAQEVRALLAVGANPNVFFPQHSLPVFIRGCSLLAAGIVVELEITRLLIQAGADLEARDKSGQTALAGAQQTLLTTDSEDFKGKVADYIAILREAGATSQ